MKFDADIDIDFCDRTAALMGLPHVDASMVDRHGEIVKHPSSVYFQDVPIDPITGFASIPYDAVGNLGYYKVDFLNNSIYEGVRDEGHLIELMDREPPWEFLLDRSIVEQLAHVHGHFGIVHHIKPKSIDDLAMVLALIRPGKEHLRFRPKEVVEADIWTPVEGKAWFKRPHAIAYATSIVVQLNLMIEQIMAELDGATDAVSG